MHMLIRSSSASTLGGHGVRNRQAGRTKTPPPTVPKMPLFTKSNIHQCIERKQNLIEYSGKVGQKSRPKTALPEVHATSGPSFLF